MVNVIITIIICATVVYCIREVLKVATLFVPVHSAEIAAPEAFTEEDVNEAYEDMRKRGELPPDITDFMQKMMHDDDFE